MEQSELTKILPELHHKAGFYVQQLQEGPNSGKYMTITIVETFGPFDNVNDAVLAGVAGLIELCRNLQSRVYELEEKIDDIESAAYDE